MRSSTRSAAEPRTPAWLALLLLAPLGASAEPYLAIESGLTCASCHVNPSGGGKRTPFGMLYARNQITAELLGADGQGTAWTGDLSERWLAVGGDFRGGYESVDISSVGEESETDVTRATVYAELRLLPQLLKVYLDAKVAPDDADTREAYLLLTPQNGRYTVKVGQFFLPFGLRLEDDDTFVRQASGVNFNRPDDGVELGLELPNWSVQAAFSDGGEGKGSNNRTSVSVSYVQPRWRVGASYNANDDPLGDREMQSIFGGLRTGPISWLAEIDFITDESESGDVDQYATLLEGNWRFRKGHNLKLGYEYLDPDRDRGEDEQERYSFVWEYSPVQLTQVRAGWRVYNGIPNFPTSNRDELFAQLHIYF